MLRSSTVSLNEVQARGTSSEDGARIPVLGIVLTLGSMSRPRSLPSLSVRNFAQIKHADVPLGDLSVLVGPQASGKSLALQLLKLCLDGQRVTRILLDNGFAWSGVEGLAERIFGEGMGRAWRKRTSVSMGGHALHLDALASEARKLSSPQQVFYVPAQRALTIMDGWPLSFPQGPLGTPFVVRQFSEHLAGILRSVSSSGRIFSLETPKLKLGLRRAVDDALFRGAALDLATIRGKTELRLIQGKAQLPTIAWTAGQREFVPLLIALYALLPAGKRTRDHDIEWIILEEPEMGLHPKGILAVMLLALELLARGYRVVLSTHHPLVLDIVWGLTRLQEQPGRGGGQRVLRMLGADPDLLPIAQAALQKRYTITHFGPGERGQVLTTDISSLDPGSSNPIVEGWGGLSGLSGRIGDIVAEAAQ